MCLSCCTIEYPAVGYVSEPLSPEFTALHLTQATKNPNTHCAPCCAAAPCPVHQTPTAPLSTPLADALRPLLEPLGQLLYDLLRPRFVQLADMETLAELIDILQHEVCGCGWVWVLTHVVQHVRQQSRQACREIVANPRPERSSRIGMCSTGALTCCCQGFCMGRTVGRTESSG